MLLIVTFLHKHVDCLHFIVYYLLYKVSKKLYFLPIELERRKFMEYSKEILMKEAIRKLELLDDILKDCQETISSAIAERKLARYLLYLCLEKMKINKL